MTNDEIIADAAFKTLTGEIRTRDDLERLYGIGGTRAADLMPRFWDAGTSFAMGRMFPRPNHENPMKEWMR